MKEKLKNFYKVAENGRTYVSAIFFNPITKEEFSATIYDYDDERVQINAGVMYSMEINEDIRKMWLHKHNIIQVGDLVQINRGRKFKGEQKRVIKEFTYSINGMYGRPYGDIQYLVFDDNTKVAKDNCDLIQEFDRYFIYKITFERKNNNGEIQQAIHYASDYKMLDNQKIRVIENYGTYTFGTEFLKSIEKINFKGEIKNEEI